MKENNKQIQIEKVLETIIELEVTKGHMKWRMSDLARTSGVTRSLLYYYFGNDIKEIFRQAVQYHVDQFFEFRLERSEKIRKGEITELIAVARRRFRRNPYYLQFYAKHRSEKNEVSTFRKK